MFFIQNKNYSIEKNTIKREGNPLFYYAFKDLKQNNNNVSIDRRLIKIIKI